MSVHLVTVLPGPFDYAGVLRPPARHRQVEGGYELTFEPDLSPAEAATLALIVAAVHAAGTLSATEFAVIQERIDGPLLTFRNQTQAAFRQQFPNPEDQTLELRRRLIDVIAVLRAAFRAPG